jgi:hypothetical protein
MREITIRQPQNGKVTHVEAVAANPVQRTLPLLQNSAAENMQHWTFAKPSLAPYTQVIVYDYDYEYEYDSTLPPSGRPSSLRSTTKVTFDLPDRVNILIKAENTSLKSAG